MSGVFSLETPHELLAKLSHDLGLMAQKPNDPYRAYNFFITAEHMLDWVYPGKVNRIKRREVQAAEVLLQICSHVASGAKHFVAEAKHHSSVVRTGLRRGNPFRSPLLQSPLLHGGGIPGLYIALDGTARSLFGSSIRAIDLAERLFNFWRVHPRLSGHNGSETK